MTRMFVYGIQRRWRRGRWVVLKQRDPFNPDAPWKVILWGGNGEHWADGAEVESWDEAWTIAHQARQEYLSHDRHYRQHFERDFIS